MEKHYNTNILSHESDAKTTVYCADYSDKKLCKTPDFPRLSPKEDREKGPALDQGVGV